MRVINEPSYTTAVRVQKDWCFLSDHSKERMSFLNNFDSLINIINFISN